MGRTGGSREATAESAPEDDHEAHDDEQDDEDAGQIHAPPVPGRVESYSTTTHPEIVG